MTRAEIERHGATAVLRLTTEENLVDTAFLDEVNGALDEIEAAPDLDGLVTVGAGKCFSNGFDLPHIMGLGDGAAAFLDRSHALAARLLAYPIPTVAAMNGHTFGYGAIFALAHDQRVMRADRGWFCLPEVDLGLQLHPFWNALVSTRLGDATALEAITTARRYDGPTAVTAGIAAVALPLDALVDASVERVQARSGKPAEMVATLKRDLYAPLLALLG